MEQDKRFTIIIALASVIIAIVVLASNAYVIINSLTGEEKMKNKILLIGIDAMDPNVVDKLISEGKLPNFKKLKETGSYARLETTMPPETPVAWTAAATGTNPGKYGVFDFINRDPKTYLPRLSLSVEEQGLTGTRYESAIKGTPFWRITSGAKIPTTVIRWPVTFPPEKINGKMLSGLGVVDIKGFLNSYRFYTSGSYDKESEGSEKVILVEIKNNTIDTKLFGPLARKNNTNIEIEKPMKIIVEKDRATLVIDSSSYPISTGNWSNWIRVKFKIDFFTEVYGIFKVYLLNATPVFNMYITSVQIDPENPIVDISYPKEYAKELANSIGLYYTLGIPEDTKAVTENRISRHIFLEQINQIEEERTKMFWHEFGRFKEGLYAFGFDAGDRLQHIFWENKVLDEDDEFIVAEEIENYYIEKDRFLGELLNKIDNNTFLIIFSDHGFNSFERAVSINRWLVDNSYMTLTKEPIGKDEGGLFKYVDWSKTKAYSLGFASIYINTIGREGQGIVDESEKEKIIDEIIEKLSNLIDNKTGKKSIKKLYKNSELYSGLYTDEGPEIVVGFEQGYRMSWQNAIGGLTKEIFTDNNQEWVGDHLIDKSFVPGVIFTNFKIKKQNPHLMDITPTVLNIFNIQEPTDIDGKSLI